MNVIGNGNGECDDALEDVLRRFYEECPEPSPEDEERWRGLNPEHGEAITAFAAEARTANAVLSAGGITVSPERAAEVARRADELTRRLVEQDRRRCGREPRPPTAG